jgi:hypothetical protein
MISYATFISGLTALSITSVKKTFTSPPGLINKDDLPIAYPRLPGGDVAISSLSGDAGLNTVVVELVVVVNPIKSSLHEINFGVSLGVIDDLNATLTEYASELQIDRWSIRTDVDIVGDLNTLYWLVVAEITASG